MQLRFNFGLLLILCCFQVAAKDSLDNLIKQQKNADESTLRAHKLEKKDVYSNAQRNAFTLGDLPQEKNCFIINRIELEDNFLGGQLISEVQKAIAGRCVGSAGVQKIAAALQDYYINAGYITTRISFPSQDISKGKLRFQVNAGKIEKTIVEGNDISEWMVTASFILIHTGEKTGAFGQVTTIGAMKKRAVTRQPRWVICLIQRKWGICFISPVRVVLPDSMKTSVVIIPFLWGTGSTAFSIAKVNRSR